MDTESLSHLCLKEIDVITSRIRTKDNDISYLEARSLYNFMSKENNYPLLISCLKRYFISNNPCFIRSVDVRAVHTYLSSHLKRFISEDDRDKIKELHLLLTT